MRVWLWEEKMLLMNVQAHVEKEECWRDMYVEVYGSGLDRAETWIKKRTIEARRKEVNEACETVWRKEAEGHLGKESMWKRVKAKHIKMGIYNLFRFQVVFSVAFYFY